MIGWLGVALTGSDTSGGVMGKMIDGQSIVVASTATKWYGHEGSILRFVFSGVVIRVSVIARQRRLWVRLHEKGGKFHEIPCHQTLEGYLAEYIACARLAETPGGSPDSINDFSIAGVRQRGSNCATAGY
jgi:hypothetical protein